MRCVDRWLLTLCALLSSPPSQAPARPALSSAPWPPPPPKRLSTAFRPGTQAPAHGRSTTVLAPVWAGRGGPPPAPARSSCSITSRDDRSAPFSAPPPLTATRSGFSARLPGSPAGGACIGRRRRVPPGWHFTLLADRVFWQIAERDACEATPEWQV